MGGSILDANEVTILAPSERGLLGVVYGESQTSLGARKLREYGFEVSRDGGYVSSLSLPV